MNNRLNNLKILSAALMLGWILGCQNNPYEDKPHVLPPGEKPPPQQEFKPQPIATYNLLVQDVMKFEEGVASTYQIVATVPAPGSPNLHWDNLPAGMVFDPNTSQISWTAPVDALKDPNFPNDQRRFVVARADLSSSLAPESVTSKVFVITVNKVATDEAVSLKDVDSNEDDVERGQ